MDYITLQDPTYVKEIIITYDELTTDYTEIYDFGINELARAKSVNIGFKNTTNVDIIIKFGSLNNQDNEHTIDAGDREVLDNFKIIGKIYAKIVTGTATKGRLKVWSW